MRMLIVVLSLLVGLSPLAACGKKGALEAPPHSDSTDSDGGS